MKRVLITAAVTGVVTAAVAQTNTFLGGTDWDEPTNWFLGHAPTLSEDAVIPSSLYCLISSQNAVARTVTIAGTAELEILNGHTLQIRTPNDSGTPALVVNGELNIGDDGVLKLEDDTSGDAIARITGSGTIFGDDAYMLTDTSPGTNAVDKIYVDEDITVTGEWDVTVDYENDGTFIATGLGTSNFLHPSCPNSIVINGSGLFETQSGGWIQIREPDMSDFTGTLSVTGNGEVIYLYHCGMSGGGFDLGAADIVVDDGTLAVGNFDEPAALILDGGSIEVTNTGAVVSTLGAMLTSTNVTIENSLFESHLGFYATGCTITVDGGDLHSYGVNNDLELTNTNLTVTGGGGIVSSAHNVEMYVASSGSSSISVEAGATLTCTDLRTGSNGTYSLDVEDATIECDGHLVMTNATIGVLGALECDHFELTASDLLIESGLLQVNGLPEFENAPSDFIGGSIIITGGAFKIGWGFQSYSGVDLYILGGALEVLADEDEERPIAFVHDAGDFLFTAGSIKVAQGEKFLAD
jgi:hypothetical protein